MRKNRWKITALLLIGALLAGCQTSRTSRNAAADAWTGLNTEVNEGCLEPISADLLSQNIYDVLREEWDDWNTLSDESKLLSSHLPGYCRRGFDDWAECEAFLGLSIPNPLEECLWLEKATYVAMPIGFRGAPRVEVSWYGTEEGHVEWISVQAGYRSGQIRVILDAALYGDPADRKPSDRGWSVELERKDYLANMGDAQLQITAESTEDYFSNVAYQACGNVLYRFNIVGEPDEQAEVESTLEQAVGAFSEERLFHQSAKM